MKPRDTTIRPAPAPSVIRKRCSCPTCSCAGRALPIHEFGRNQQSPDGYHWYCKNCNNAKQREWKRQNATKVEKWRKLRAKNRKRQLNLELT